MARYITCNMRPTNGPVSHGILIFWSGHSQHTGHIQFNNLEVWSRKKKGQNYVCVLKLIWVCCSHLKWGLFFLLSHHPLYIYDNTRDLNAYENWDPASAWASAHSDQGVRISPVISSLSISTSGDQRRDWSDCASAQSDQGLRCSHGL